MLFFKNSRLLIHNLWLPLTVKILSSPTKHKSCWLRQLPIRFQWTSNWLQLKSTLPKVKHNSQTFWAFKNSRLRFEFMDSVRPLVKSCELTIPQVWDRLCAVEHCLGRTRTQLRSSGSTLRAPCRTLCELWHAVSAPGPYEASLSVSAALQSAQHNINHRHQRRFRVSVAFRMQIK